MVSDSVLSFWFVFLWTQEIGCVTECPYKGSKRVCVCVDHSRRSGGDGSSRAEGDRHQRLRTQTQDHQRSGEAHQWAAE